MKNLYSLLLVLFALSACSVDDSIDSKNRDQNNSASETNNLNVSVSKDGYLILPTTQDLQCLVEEISNNTIKNINSIKKTKSTNTRLFESVADLDSKITRQITKATTKEDNDYDEFSTIDEYNLAKAEDLLMDDIMTHIVDTTLRICVENRLYKITELGTFSVDINKQYLLEETINRINSTIIDSLKAGESITLLKER